MTNCTLRVRQMIYQVHNVCAEQGELLADVLSEQYGELADMYEESVETTELHRIDAMMSAWRWRWVATS